MRLFIGLGLDTPTLLSLEQYRTNAFLSEGTNVTTSNFHVTLCFLGQCQAHSRQLALLDERLSDIKASSFSAHFDMTGYWNKPKIQFVGISDIPSALSQLHQQVETAAHQCHFAIEKRPYRPHITLQRKVKVESIPLFQPSILAHFNDFHLYESSSSPKGVVYRKLKTYPLISQPLRPVR